MAEPMATIGWREWVVLPDLGIERIKAKIDTGARTSALHAFEVKAFRDRGVRMVRFLVHPLQKRTDVVKECVAEVVDRRWVTDSGGHKAKRYVIVSRIRLAGQEWDTEFTLTGRDTMKFRMLLGRTAMAHRFVVDPGASYLHGRPVRKPKKRSTA